MRDSLLPLFTTFQTDFKTRICNSYFEICLKRSEKRQERIPHRPIQNLINLQTFFVFFSFYKLVSQIKIHLVYKRNIVDFISVIFLT